MKRAIRLLSAVGIAAALAAGAVYAETLKMNPGNWETTVVMNHPMLGNQTNTQTQCIEEEEFDPNQFLQGQEECTMVEQNVSGNTLTFEMECNAQGTRSSMTGEMSITDDTGTGSMQISMEVAGQKFDMKMDFDSKRLGDC